MVMILPKEEPWYVEPAQKFAAGVSQGYQNRADEMALQRAIGGLSEKATPRQILDTITGTQTYNPQSKQTAFKNYLGASQFEELQKQHRENEEIRKNTKELQTLKEQQKKTKEKGSAKALIEASELQEDEKEDLLQKVEDEVVDVETVKQLTKPNKQTSNEFQKGLAKENVKIYSEAQKDLVEANRALGDLEKIDALRERLSGPLGYVKAFNPFNEDAAEINALGFGAIKPIVKIFNPSGPIAQKKLEQLEKKYGISATESSATIKGKTAALRRYATEAQKLAQMKIRLISEYNGNPPLGVIAEIDAVGNNLLDHMAVADIPGEEVKTPEGGPDPSKFAGKTVKFPDGKQYVSNGEVWTRK